MHSYQKKNRTVNIHIMRSSQGFQQGWNSITLLLPLLVIPQQNNRTHIRKVILLLLEYYQTIILIKLDMCLSITTLVGFQTPLPQISGHKKQRQ